MQAHAYWTVGPRQGEIRAESLRSPTDGEALVRTLHSGISRGTELLVHRHQVPPEVARQMRAPHQEGTLPGPVKYGYLNVGTVEAGPGQLMGRRVFSLFPHQDRFVIDADSVTVLPDELPPARAVLAGTAETAVNAVWDSGVTLGDRVAVVGAGMVGLSLALTLSKLPLHSLQLIDPDPDRATVCARLGLDLRTPDAADADLDVVFHTSAHADGLATGLRLLGVEGTLVELSWYGTSSPVAPLGLDFHARRLRIVASQVSRVSAARSARRGFAERMAIALDLLRDPHFDELLSPPVDFHSLPDVFTQLDDGGGSGLCTLVRYPQED